MNGEYDCCCAYMFLVHTCVMLHNSSHTSTVNQSRGLLFECQSKRRQTETSTEKNAGPK